MRITNKIIQNNSLNNINVNKKLQDTLSTQIATGKVIARPSDDPIVALRSLRLRTSVNQTSQYLDKNVEDAESWLEVTEDAINSFSNIITDVRKQYTKGAQDTLTASDRKIVLEDLQALAEELYNTGNVDFAGRSVFTGYRTGDTLTFQKDEDIQTKIYETNETATLDAITYVHTPDLTGAVHETEQEVYTAEITRIRLSYNELDNTVPSVTIDGADYTPTVMSKTATDPYAYIKENPDDVVFVPETGEILIGANIGDKESIKEFSVTYEKTKWETGQLKPEHYFKCEDLTNGVKYNFDGSPVGEINYNIGVNQVIRINTNASECFNHDLLRDIQDAISALKEVDDIETKISDLQSQISKTTDETVKASLQKDLDALKKSKTYLSDKLHTLMSKGIANTDKYLDKNNVALTNCGTRSKRLELVQNRLDTQLNTLKELKSENEDIDVAEAAIQLSSAGYAYNASLMATSKILQESLINYI